MGFCYGRIYASTIRGLDVDRLAKGYAEVDYIFKRYCNVSTMKGDSIRWYQETYGDLDATSPSTLLSSRLGEPETLEAEWTRNTSYPKKYFVRSNISVEDIQSADLDVLRTTVRKLTRAIVKQVDAHIWDVMSESQSPSLIQTFATTAVGGDQWDAADYAADIMKDLMRAKKMIRNYDYDPEGAILMLDPTGYESLVNWLVSGKGTYWTEFGSEKIKTGEVMKICGLKVVVSNNVTTDYAMVFVPQRATTFKQYMPTKSVVIDEPGMHKEVRVWEAGVAYNTDPKAIVLITGINS